MHFLRRYADVYGDTPVRSLTHHRMVVARRLLETTQLSVTDICAAAFGSWEQHSPRRRGFRVAS